MQRDEWSIDQFELLNELYRGKTSLLHEAFDKCSGRRVAVKQYRKAQLSPLNRRQIEREIWIHTAQAHPHIITLHAAFETSDTVFLVQEFAAGGDLFEALKHRPDFQYDEQHAAGHLLAQLLEALVHLHHRGVLHRDIKPENILLGADGAVKLADFGLALDSRMERAVTRVGTLDYMSPEVLVCPDKKRPEENKDKATLAYTTQVDTWAVGCLAAELVGGSPPFESESRSATYQMIMYRQPRLPDRLSPAAKAFITAALSKKPEERATAEQLLQHEWITSHRMAICTHQQQAREAAVAAAAAEICEAPAPAVAATFGPAAAAVAARATLPLAAAIDYPHDAASVSSTASAPAAVASAVSASTGTTSAAAVAAGNLSAAATVIVTSSNETTTGMPLAKTAPPAAAAAVQQAERSGTSDECSASEATASGCLPPPNQLQRQQQAQQQEEQQQQHSFAGATAPAPATDPIFIDACNTTEATGACSGIAASVAVGTAVAAEATACQPASQPVRQATGSGHPLHHKLPKGKHRRSSYSSNNNWDDFIETVSRSGLSFTAAQGAADEPESSQVSGLQQQQQPPIGRSSLVQQRPGAAESAGRGAASMEQLPATRHSACLSSSHCSGSASHHDTLQALPDAEAAVVSDVLARTASGALHLLMPSTLEDLIAPTITPQSTLSDLGLAMRHAHVVAAAAGGTASGHSPAVPAPAADGAAWSEGGNYDDCISPSAGRSQLSFTLRRSGGSVPCCLSILAPPATSPSPPGSLCPRGLFSPKTRQQESSRGWSRKGSGLVEASSNSCHQMGASAAGRAAALAAQDTEPQQQQQRRRRTLSLGPTAQEALLNQQQVPQVARGARPVLHERSGMFSAVAAAIKRPPDDDGVDGAGCCSVVDRDACGGAEGSSNAGSSSGGGSAAVESPKAPGRKVVWADTTGGCCAEFAVAASTSPCDSCANRPDRQPSYYVPPNGVLSSDVLPSPRLGGMEAAQACAAAAVLARACTGAGKPLSSTVRAAASRYAVNLTLLSLSGGGSEDGCVVSPVRAGSFTAGAARPLTPTKVAAYPTARSKSLTGDAHLGCL